MLLIKEIALFRSMPVNWTTYRCYKRSNLLSAKLFKGDELHPQKGIIRNCFARFFHDSEIESKNFSPDDSKRNIEELVAGVGIDQDTISEAFRKEPLLLEVHPVLWQSSLKALITGGFSGKECVNLITASPSLLKVKPDVILLGITNWQTTLIGDQKLLSLLATCPQLFFVAKHEISRRFPVLKSLSSQKNIVEFLKLYPDYMFTDWNNFMAKLNYVEEEMKIDKNKISKCDFLSCSLFELRTRHIFLERTGNYVVPNPKTAHLPNNNPSLRQIIDSDDIHFATKVAGLTLEEFEVFRELYKKEISENDDDSDTECD